MAAEPYVDNVAAMPAALLVRRLRAEARARNWPLDITNVDPPEHHYGMCQIVFTTCTRPRSRHIRFAHARNGMYLCYPSAYQRGSDFAGWVFRHTHVRQTYQDVVALMEAIVAEALPLARNGAPTRATQETA